jgi:hypothetical protein
VRERLPTFLKESGMMLLINPGSWVDGLQLFQRKDIEAELMRYPMFQDDKVFVVENAY